MKKCTEIKQQAFQCTTNGNLYEIWRFHGNGLLSYNIE
jgi:hypothetical protein